MTTIATSKRAAIADEYGIDQHGLIMAPGKYEIEPWYTPVLDGMEPNESFGDATEGTGYYSLYILNPDDPTEGEVVIASGGMVGFVTKLTTEGFVVLVCKFATEANARQYFEQLEREYQD